ncbi:MAG: H-X9-DG-CTERM domain-containing protein [Armatimonadota bacterium]
MAASGNNGGSGVRAALLWLRSLVWRTGLTVWRFPLQAVLARCLLVLPVLFLAAIISPIFVGVGRSSHRPHCQRNLKVIGVALQMYAQDYDDRLPSFTDGSVDLRAAIDPYLKDPRIWDCPETRDRESRRRPVYYGYNYLALAPGGLGIELEGVDRPQDLLVMADANGPGLIPTALEDRYAGTPPEYRHKGGAGCLWLDGHVRWTRPVQLEKRFGDTGTLRDFPYWWPRASRHAQSTSRAEEARR